MARDYAARNPKPSSGSRRPSSGKKKSGGGLPGWVLMLAGLSIGLLVAVFVYVSRPTVEPLRGTSAASDRPSRNKPADRSAAAAQPDEEEEPPQTAKPSAKAAPQRGRKPGDDDTAKVTVPPKEKSRFTFYELLPSQEVLVPSQPQAKLTPQQQQALAQQQQQTATAASPATPVNGIATTPGTPPASIPPSSPPSTAPSAATTGTFIIQVASYRSQAEAEKQKAALALAGVESRIEKVTIDNKDTYYRVRVGPLRDEAKARDTLAQLESNGINAMLVKVK